MSTNGMPTVSALVDATLKSLVKRGGTAATQEVQTDIAAVLGLSEEVLAVPATGGRSRTEVARLASRARVYLRQMEAVENPRRGVWAITEYGRRLDSEGTAGEAFYESFKEYFSRKSDHQVATEFGLADVNAPEDEWEGALLDILRQIPPDAFERLCQLVLSKRGFTRVEVTGRTGDGGIDGVGVLRLNLISFHVVFQCKRYEKAVGTPHIREFRGAMTGRADKGLILTTSHFSVAAQREAVRDGVPTIDLIDGSELCQLLKDLKLGVRTELVERVTVEPAFFKSI